MKFLNNAILFWLDISTRRDRIKSDPERQRRSIYFGVRSIATSLFGFIVAALCVWGIIALAGSGEGLGQILEVILIFLLALFAIVALLQGIVQGLVCFIVQLRINKRAIGWVALAVWLALLIAAVTFVLLMI